MMQKTADALNVLGNFCAKRDLRALTQSELEARCAARQADVMVLFGGSILAGGDLLADAMREGVARKYLIVGGEGHTTQALRDRVHALYPDFETDGLPEARVFEGYLARKHALCPDGLECASTNCGNNITNLLHLLREEKIDCGRIILCQDASMQRRMEAGMRKYAPEMDVISFAAYRAEVVVRDRELAFAQEICGMWSIERYAELLMGEIPRLTDDEGGYGPRGKGFIAHVEIPKDVRQAFEFLKARSPEWVRGANPKYAS